MNILYIIGNGFDKAQGMKTSYPEFYQYLMGKECSPLLEKMKKSIKEDTKLWSDMEEAFGQFTSEIETEQELEDLYFELSDCLQSYLIEEEKAFIPTEEHQHKFLEDFISPEKYLDEADRARYSRVAHGLDSMKHINVVTLNYTKTFESLLALDKAKKTDMLSKLTRLDQILHLHGRLGESIIIGVDNESQIANDKYKKSEDVKDYLVKTQSNSSMKYTRSNTFETLIESAHLIILYGVSLGDTDLRWWRLIGNQFKKRNNLFIIQFLYSPLKITPTRRQLLGRAERTQRSALMKKFGFEGEKEWPREASDRLFFIINSNAFK